MKRRNFKAIVTDNTDSFTIIGEQTTFAWNSAIKASEAIVRQHARDSFTIYSGAKPVVTTYGEFTEDSVRIYRRTWTTDAGVTVHAMVTEVK